MSPGELIDLRPLGRGLDRVVSPVNGVGLLRRWIAVTIMRRRAVERNIVERAVPAMAGQRA